MNTSDDSNKKIYSKAQEILENTSTQDQIDDLVKKGILSYKKKNTYFLNTNNIHDIPSPLNKFIRNEPDPKSGKIIIHIENNVDKKKLKLREKLKKTMSGLHYLLIKY